MLNGKIRIDGKGLTVKQRGKTKFSSFDDISKIVLTKTLSGKTWVQLVVISLSDFKKIYIYDHYDKTAEEIFDFLNNDMEIKKSRIAFAVQPAFSIT